MLTQPRTMRCFGAARSGSPAGAGAPTPAFDRARGHGCFANWHRTCTIFARLKIPTGYPWFVSRLLVRDGVRRPDSAAHPKRRWDDDSADCSHIYANLWVRLQSCITTRGCAGEPSCSWGSTYALKLYVVCLGGRRAKRHSRPSHFTPSGSRIAIAHNSLTSWLHRRSTEHRRQRTECKGSTNRRKGELFAPSLFPASEWRSGDPTELPRLQSISMEQRHLVWQTSARAWILSIRNLGAACLRPSRLLVPTSTGATCSRHCQLAQLSTHRSCKFLMPGPIETKCSLTGPSLKMH